MSTATIVQIPFNRLRRSASNVRRSGRESAAYKAGIEVLAASILATHKQTGQGLLQNLVVHAVDEFFDVAAGGRRLDALGLLIDRAEFVDTYPVPCLVIGDDAVIAASLAENVQRESMHPVDEFNAFLSLVEQGWSIDRIADGFGVTPLVVERRLKLRAAAPALLEDFRADVLSTDQLIALCASDNHDRQLDVWNRVKNQGWGKEPSSLRRAVMETEVEASKDLRVAFVGGVDAYEAAGGLVRRDLFAAEGEGLILEDAAVLDALVDAKLHEQAEALRIEGWAWVEVWRQMDYTAFDRFGKAPSITIELSEDVTQQVAALDVEHEYLRDEIDDLEANDEALTDEQGAQLSVLCAKLKVLEQEVDKLSKRVVTFSPEVIAHCGALVVFQSGSIRIDRGLVRAADRAKLSESLGDGQRVSGGRESELAGRKVDALSDALRRSLLGYRNLAAQVVTASNVNAAKVLFVCKSVGELRRTSSDIPCDMGVATGYGSRTSCTINDEAGQAKEAEFVACGEALIAKLPKDPVALWDSIAALKIADLDTLIAYAMARSVSLAVECDGLSAKYLEALDFNMADHFCPTAANYLSRVSKGLILEALTEAGKVQGETDRSALLAMKKGALAQEAETRLAGTGWVPQLIRTQTVKPLKSKAKKASAKAVTSRA